MVEETWTCPSCTQALPANVRVCPTCNVTQVRSRLTGGPAAPSAAPAPAGPTGDVPLPRTIPDARYILPLKEGKAWTSGLLLASEAGLFLVSAGDKLSADDLARNPPAGPARLGPNSIFLPKPLVLRVVHDRLKGFFIETEGRRIQLRLSVEGWRELDAVCDKLGMARE